MISKKSGCVRRSKSYERAIQLAPFSAMYRYEQARLYWLLGERSDAERRAKEAENLEPNFFLPASCWPACGLMRGRSTRQETSFAKFRRAKHATSSGTRIASIRHF